MRVAIPTWQGRISPVFDVAGTVLVFDIDDGEATPQGPLALEVEGPYDRAERLAGRGVGLLVCGAISREQAQAVASAGIELISQTCGDVQSVVAALRDGRLEQGPFAMPGCGRRGQGLRRRRRGRACRGFGRRFGSADNE